MHVLVVEKSRKLLKELSVGLEERGIQITSANTLQQAFKRLALHSFDAILLDLSLSDSDGIATFYRVRELALDIPIIVSTDLEEEDLALACIQAGAQGHVVKDAVSCEAIQRRLEFAIEETKIAHALQKSEKRLRIILENSYDAFISVDRSWQCEIHKRQIATTFIPLNGLK